MHICRANHWTQVIDTYGRVMGRIEEAVGDNNLLRRQTVSSNQEPWELVETKPSSKEHTWDGACH